MAHVAAITDPTPDDEWRAERFSREEIAGARQVLAMTGRTPSLAKLKRALEAHGPDGILESAIMLPREEFEELEKLVRKAPRPRTVHQRRKR